jgi:acyl-CoA thioester hydrolase
MVAATPPHDLPTEGRIEAGRHLLPVRVYFEDTDHSGIVYHANYLRYMERARTEMLRHVGVEHAAGMERGDGFWTVHAMNIVWHRPARIDDCLVVVTTVAKVRAAATELTQKVLRGDELLCSATVTAAFLAMNGRPQRQSKAWHDRFTALMRAAMPD